jgi:hypothetical protein
VVVSRVFRTFDLPWNLGRLFVEVVLPLAPMGASGKVAQAMARTSASLFICK